MTEDEITKLVRKANERLAKMTPEEREAMWQAQKESWVRGEMALSELERATTIIRHTDGLIEAVFTDEERNGGLLDRKTIGKANVLEQLLKPIRAWFRAKG